MDITLVTSIMNDDIHGTDNDKKTGCGINLQKGDNINKYRRGGKTDDLKEITCERCKNAFAKKMIKADKKEMARILKEEKQREKLGLADEGIVPLGGTTAKITSSPSAAASAPEPEQPAVPFERNPNPKKRPEKTIAGTGVALDSTLAQFNIKPASSEQQAPPPESQPPKPKNNLQDDFLAQFAVNVPANNDYESQTISPNEPEESIDFSTINPPPYEENPDLPPAEDEVPVGIIDDDDVMKMFAYGNVKASASQSPAVDNLNYSEEPDYTSSPEPVQETSSGTDWDSVANKLFGIENPQPAEPEEPEEMSDIELPSLDELSQELEPVQEYSTPEIEDIELPSLDDVTPELESVPEYNTPEFEDIELPSLDDATPELETVPEYNTPELDEIEVPDIEQEETEYESEPEYNAPVFDDIQLPEIEEPAYQEYVETVPENTGVPSLEDMAVLVEQEENSEETTEEDFAEDSEEVYESEDFYEEEYAEEPVQSVQQTPPPVQSPYPQQPIYPQQPVYPQQPAYSQQPVYQQQNMIGQVMNVPQFNGYVQNNHPIYTYVPMQLTGYGPNGQPIYMPFGQPAMQQPYGQPFPQPVQPNAVPVQPQQSVPVAPQNENKPLTPGQKIAAAAAAKGGMPATSANVSKISVHEHSKSTSQVFINAIAESKEYANKSLTETQGNSARNMPVLNSIEDMLSAMGDNSEKEKRLQQEKMKKNVPVYQEYTASSNNTVRTQPKTTKPAEPQRPLTKAELREKKKQEKIDAKFKKDLAKKGF